VKFKISFLIVAYKNYTKLTLIRIYSLCYYALFFRNGWFKYL